MLISAIFTGKKYILLFTLISVLSYIYAFCLPLFCLTLESKWYRITNVNRISPKLTHALDCSRKQPSLWQEVHHKSSMNEWCWNGGRGAYDDRDCDDGGIDSINGKGCACFAIAVVPLPLWQYDQLSIIKMTHFLDKY